MHRWKVCFNVFNQLSAGLYQMCEKPDPVSQRTESGDAISAFQHDFLIERAGINLFRFFMVLFCSEQRTAFKCCIGAENDFGKISPGPDFASSQTSMFGYLL